MLTTEILIQWYNGTKGRKKTSEQWKTIAHKAAWLSELTSRGRQCCWNRKYLFFAHGCLAKAVFKWK